MSQLQAGDSVSDDSLYCILCRHLESRISELGQCDKCYDRVLPKCSQEELEMYDSAGTSSNINSLDQKYDDLTDENINKSKGTLQSLVQSSLKSCRHKPESCQIDFKSSGNDLLHHAEHLMLHQNKTAKISWHPHLSMTKGGQVGQDSFNFQLIKPCFECQLEKKPQSHSNESKCFSSSSVTPERTETAKKRRITWTEDLHEQFTECVNRLGGAKKATPRAILKLMNCDGLTISNIKSHLQKYRVAWDVKESSKDADETEASSHTSSLPAVSSETFPQILEALKLQMSVQQSLYEQLEIQRSLQLRIEEQAKQLKEMFDRQSRD